MRHFWFVCSIICIVFSLAMCNSKVINPQKTPIPVSTPTPQLVQLSPLQVCADKVHFCVNGNQIYLRGYSDYGAFSLPWDYEQSFVVYKNAHINFSRQWASPIPKSWGGLQPFTFANGDATLVNDYWNNADRFISLAQQNGIYVMVDLTDHYGVYQSKTFNENPLNSKLGGPLANGIPDLYTNPKILEMVRKSVTRLSKYPNVVYQACNEPGGGTVAQITAFHKKIVEIVHTYHPNALVGINVINDANGRPQIPNAREVGADFITVHQAGIENIKDAKSCSPSILMDRLKAIQSWNKVPVIADTDALYNTNYPCNRDNNKILLDIATASKVIAGMNHRDNEISIDHDAIKAIQQ